MNFDKNVIFNIYQYNKQLWIQRMLNRILYRFRIKVKASQLVNNGTDMVSEFHILNFFHLLNRVIQENVEGDVVELGCFDGQSGTLFQTILVQNKSNRKLYLFDNFIHDFGLNENIKDRLINNFNKRNLPLPVIIDGNFEDTLADNLPEKICFLHIDCGHGGDVIIHKNTILHCLEHSYSKMSKGAVGIFMDYHDVNITLEGVNSNPGVKLACDEFFADKPEKVYTLYGGEYSHGYFVKGLVHNG